MGRSDPWLNSFYTQAIKPKGATALLGFTENNFFNGDLYDLKLGNWEINSDWKLDKMYDTIISLRCPYFAKDPQAFLEKCREHLNPGGKLYADWGLGDHWRFDEYKVGWVKDGEHEFAYNENNFLWSGVWDDSFLQNEELIKFSKRVERFGYNDIKKAIHEEIPYVMQLNSIDDQYKVGYRMLALWEDRPQLYILLECQKGER